MTDEEIGAWTSAHDVPQWATTPEGRLVSESYIRTSDVTAKLRELRDYAERMENHRLALIETAVQQRDRIAALEAELATLRAGTWQPVEYVQLPRGESIHADEMAITHGRDNTALWTMPLPDDGDIRLCRRVPSAPAEPITQKEEGD